MANPFQTQRKSASQPCPLLPTSQASSGRASFADARASIRRQEFDGSSMPDLTSHAPQQQEHGRQGHAVRHQQHHHQRGTRKFGRSRPMRMIWLLGWALAFVFGSDLVTGAARSVPAHLLLRLQSTDDCADHQRLRGRLERCEVSPGGYGGVGS